MKTLNELYTEVMNSEELKNEFLTLKTPEDIVTFAAKNGCNATMEEIGTFFAEKAQPTAELSEDDLAQVAGGKNVSIGEAAMSLFSVGTACTVLAIISAAGGEDYRCGTAIKSSGMLCKTVNDDEREYGKNNWQWF